MGYDKSEKIGIHKCLMDESSSEILHNKIRALKVSELSSGSGGDYPVIHNKLYCRDVKKSMDSFSSDVKQQLENKSIRNVRSHTELAETANGVRMIARSLATASIRLDVRTIMIATKARDNSLIFITREVVEFLLSLKRGISIYVDQKLENSKRFNAEEMYQRSPDSKQYLKYWDKETTKKQPELFDLVLTLGGDGTVLYVSGLFQQVVPPVISFAFGSLGFLTPFDFQYFKDQMISVLDSGVSAYLRMRFTCRVHRADGSLVHEQQVLNELTVDRGSSPYVTQLELYGDGSLITVSQADGLIIATPTGSTAYSLSAGGSLVHPAVSAISVTPICPHTLSFRPILLPDGMLLKVKVPDSSRATAWASFDGKFRTEIRRGDFVTIQASLFPFPTVNSSKMEFFDSASRNLNWNAREQQKPFSSYLSERNKKLLSGITITPEELNLSDDENFDINYSDDGEFLHSFKQA